ncbi:MAG: HNH nuclease family protein [Deltaproteobacteria bacterium]|nr:HNH nuclease family protein [Deltaproteobacteria bacterium]
MSSDKTQGALSAKFWQDHEKKIRGYRERALKLYPHCCGHCGREFEGKQLRELTVHHKDHNHDNNPNDGSNWELLCIYCHENEHSSHADAAWLKEADTIEDAKTETSTYKPFADLEKLLKKK